MHSRIDRPIPYEVQRCFGVRGRGIAVKQPPYGEDNCTNNEANAARLQIEGGVHRRPDPRTSRPCFDRHRSLLALLPSFPPISTGTSVDPGVIGAAAEGDGHRRGGRVDMPQSDRFADTRPGQMRTVRGTLLTEATDALLSLYRPRYCLARWRGLAECHGDEPRDDNGRGPVIVTLSGQCWLCAGGRYGHRTYQDQACEVTCDRRSAERCVDQSLLDLELNMEFTEQGVV